MTTCTPLAGQRVEIGGEGRDERLALTGLHLGDGAVVQHHAADELHVEVPHAERAHAAFADDRERLGQKVVERLTVLETLSELDGLAREFLVRERLHRGLEVVDQTDGRFVALELLALADREDFRQEVGHVVAAF